jgi:hypothetical protein
VWPLAGDEEGGQRISPSSSLDPDDVRARASLVNSGNQIESNSIGSPRGEMGNTLDY